MDRDEENSSKYRPVELESDTDVRQLQKRSWDEKGKPAVEKIKSSPLMNRKTIR